jgi:hypothetical protein
VLSNTDYVYLDCGNAGWAQAGGYWCQPYHEWQKIYNYLEDVLPLWGLSEEYQKVTTQQEKQKRDLHPSIPTSGRDIEQQKVGRILGGETLLWSEMIASVNVDQKMWPRTAGLAEALWGRSYVSNSATEHSATKGTAASDGGTSTSTSSSNGDDSQNNSERGSGKGGSWYLADPRMQRWVQVLRQRGVNAEPLQPQWCEQRAAYACTVNSGTPQ